MPAHDETRDPNTPTANQSAGGTITGSYPPDTLAARPAAVPGYELLEEVGAGGMGVVYRAREIALDRDVAVKILQDRFPVNSPSARRFLDEARITSQLQHPAIPPVHHIGTLADGRPFLVMKLIKGDTLADLLTTEPENRGRFVAVFAQVCQAVAYAHARKVIHRDLKPANVMVGAFGEVQVMDWGLAKVLTQPDSLEPTEADDGRTEIRSLRDADSATQAGSVLGTPSFMAPEQAGGEIEKIDERSDVFGLGAVLCMILTGKPPYWGPDSDSIRLMSIRGETADAFARLDACGADPELVSLAKRCLTTNRDDRPRDADEVAKSVTAHLAAAEERARRAELDRVRAEEERKRRRVQLKLAAAVFGMAAVAGIGVVVASLWQRAERAKESAESAHESEKTARADAESARDGEKRLREKLERLEYGRTINAAYQEYRDNNVGAALTLLDSSRPEWRDWEYHYVHRLCHSELFTLQQSGNVCSTSYSPDGTRIVIGCNDKTARVWDVERRTIIHTLGGHTHFVWSASFSADGSRIVTASYDGTAKVWNAHTGKELQAFKEHTDFLSSAAFSPDGSKVVTGSYDKTARVWDAVSGAALLTLEGHTGTIYSVSWSPDGSRIVTGSEDKTARVWDAKTKTVLKILKGHTGAVDSVGFGAGGTRIVTGSTDTTARVWDAEKGDELRLLIGHTGSVTSVAFSADSTRIVTGSWDRTAVVWDAYTGSELLTIKGHTNFVQSAMFSPDGSKVLTGSWDGTAKVWEAKAGPERNMLKSLIDSPSFSLSSIAASLSPDESRIVFGATEKELKVIDANTGMEVCTLKGHTDMVLSASWSADGSRILTWSWDKTVRVWEAKTGIALVEIKTDAERLPGASFSPDGSRIVIGYGNEGIAKVFNATTGDELFTLRGHTGGIYSVSWSADGSRIVTGGGRKIGPDWLRVTSRTNATLVKVWDASTGTEQLTLAGHAAELYAVSFSTDGMRIVTGSSDGTAKVWDAKTGGELLTLKGHTNAVFSVAFNPDGSRIVTASNDRTVKVWNATTGDELLTLKGHAYAFRSASFSADGTRIIAGSLDGVRVFDSRPVSREFLPREMAPQPRDLRR